MIYVILGMHKSGTTVVTQMLHESGINMGEFASDLGYNEDNKYERHETQTLNRQILHGYLIPPLAYLLKRPFRSQFDRAGYRRNRDSVALIRQRALRRHLAQDPLADEMAALIDQHEAAYADWGFKDPRTCLTYPVWQRHLPPHRVIVVYRHYNQLLRRYRVTGRHLPHLFRVLHGWTVYNQAILDALAATAVPTIVLNYERLMQGEEEFRRLNTFVGRSLNDARDPNLYRNRVANSSDLLPAARWLLPLLPADPRQIYHQLEKQRNSECQS